LEVLRFVDTSDAARFLRGLSQDYFNLSAFQSIVHDFPFSGLSGPLETHDLLDRIASALARGELRIVRIPPQTIVGAPRPEKKVAPEQAPVQMQARLSILVVDDATDDPITDLALIVKLPGGGDEKRSTDSSGHIDLSGVASGPVTVTTSVGAATIHDALVLAGTGPLSTRGVASPTGTKRSGAKRSLVRIVEHRVRTGDTLESISKTYKTTADALAKFNWGTTDKKQIDKHLWIEVGCSKKGPDGHYAFDDSDLPGIIPVPKPLDLTGLSWDETHILRVKGPPVFLFSV
jgi:LysM repeat protein